MSKTARMSHRRVSPHKGLPTLAVSEKRINTAVGVVDAMDAESNRFNRAALITAAHRIGFRVLYGEKFLASSSEGYVQTDERADPVAWTAQMLHELGHAELWLLRDKHHPRANQRLSMAVHHFRSISSALRAFYLRKEWKAWERGMIIARREGIRISERQYWAVARHYYGTYVRWTCLVSFFEARDLQRKRVKAKQGRMKPAQRRAIVLGEVIEPCGQTDTIIATYARGRTQR